MTLTLTLTPTLPLALTPTPGILALYDERLRDRFDMKIFVDADPDVRLARRIRRDMAERGRDLDGVLQQCSHINMYIYRPSPSNPDHAHAPSFTLTSTCGLALAPARPLPRPAPTNQPTTTITTTRYEQFVKPSFETFIGPSKSHADIVVPRGAENLVAIELIAQHINSLLIEREAAGVALEWDEHERSGGAIPEEEAVEQ